MEDQEHENVRALREAGLIRVSKLPAAHARVVENLNPDHVKVIKEVADQLRQADQELEYPHPEALPRFTNFIVF